MKNIILLSIALILAFCGYGQSISFERDTVQVLHGSDAGNVASADIDMDGDIDILITGNGPGTGVSTTLYANDGSGNFVVLDQPAIVNVFAGAAEFADVDNDGDPDLLITGNTNSPATTANLYLNDGIGSFSIAVASGLEASKHGDIDFGDIDGDGDIDLITTGKNSSGDLIAQLYTNDGSGTYSLVNGTVFVPVWSSSVEFIDTDNDNDLDLLICGQDSSESPNTTLYLNNGSGSFTAVTGTPFVATQTGDIAYGDTDNDGDQDLLITGYNNDFQYISAFYVNNGGTFNLLPNAPFPGVALHSSSFADFNNDGNLDLLHIGVSADGLIGHVYENIGSNNFILADSTLAGSYNGENEISDLNGDGKLDIITTGTSFTMPLRAPKIYFNQSTTVSINEAPNKEFQVRIFPNPASGYINIETTSDSRTDVTIYDLMGSQIFRNIYFESKFNIQLNVPSGAYFLHLSNETLNYRKKVIVE